MKQFFLFIWQLPQNLIGCLLWLISNYGSETVETYKGDKVKIHYSFLIKGSAVSLGNFIFLGRLYKNTKYETQVKKTASHEHGHQFQSKKLGWLYLFIVGIPSAVRNVYDRIAHKNWNYYDRIQWYYGSFPEKQADKYGGVDR